MAVKFVAYIDESGDTGIERLKSSTSKGATEWFVLSCFLVRIEKDEKTGDWVREIISKFKNHQKPDLHFADLIDVKKRIACEILSRKQCALFVAVSNKKSIEGYRNPNLEGKNKDWVYWYLSRILLERVTEFCERHVPVEYRDFDKVRIIFSRRGGLKYADFARYLVKLRWQSRHDTLKLDKGDLSRSVVDDEEIYVLRHEERPGLQLADIVAGSFFSALERNRPKDCNPEFAKALHARMGCDTHGNIIGHGIKTLPNLHEVTVHPSQREIFEFYGYNPDGWRPGHS